MSFILLIKSHDMFSLTKSQRSAVFVHKHNMTTVSFGLIKTEYIYVLPTIFTTYGLNNLLS